MKQNFRELWEKAVGAAQIAALAENEKLGPEGSRGLDCGFAWIVIKPARGGMAYWLKKNAIGRVREYGGGGLEVWYSKLHGLNTQSVSVHYAAAKAASQVLQAAGVNAYADQRLD